MLNSVVALKKANKLIELLLGDGIVFVIMATSATYRETQPYLTDGARPNRGSAPRETLLS